MMRTLIASVGVVVAATAIVLTQGGRPASPAGTAATEIGGNAWEVAGRIWYEALRDPALRPDAGFASFARLTVSAAERLQGQGSPAASAVREAWDNVGVPTEQPALQSLTAH